MAHWKNAARSTSTTTSRSTITTTACPTHWCGRTIDVRVTSGSVECFVRGKRVAGASAQRPTRLPHHLARAHASLAPGARRVVAGPNAQLGDDDRSAHRRPRPRPARIATASRTGLPRLPGHLRLARHYGEGTAGGSLCPRRRTRRNALPVGRFDPQVRTGPPAASRPQPQPELPSARSTSKCAAARYYH